MGFQYLSLWLPNIENEGNWELSPDRQVVGQPQEVDVWSGTF